MVALRLVVDGLAVTLTLTLLPSLLTLHHVSLVDIDHVVLEVTVNELLPAAAGNEMLLLLTVSVASAPSCVTVTVWLLSPAFTVIVVLRSVVDGLADILTLTLLPSLLNTHHVESHETDHSVLEVTVKMSFPPVAENVMLLLLNVSVASAPAWVTVTVWGVTPSALTVMVVLRSVVDEFADTLTLTVLPSLLSIHHVESHETDHSVLELIVNDLLSPAAENEMLFNETLRYFVGPGVGTEVSGSSSMK